MLFPAPSVNAAYCPDGYVELYGRCFHFFNTVNSNYLEARQICETIQGDLAIVNDCNVHGALASYISNSGQWAEVFKIMYRKYVHFEKTH